jgi:RNA polymerase sigma-70 factor, ECF subfamily
VISGNMVKNSQKSFEPERHLPTPITGKAEFVEAGRRTGGRLMGVVVGVASSDDYADLVAAVATSRDRYAFARLFDFFAPRIYAYLLRLRLEPGVADELTQEVMTTLWQKADLFDRTKSSVGTWLYRIARNRRIDLLRRDREDMVADPRAHDVPDPSPAPDDTLDLSQREASIRAALRLLPQEQLDLVRLAFFEGLSHGDIAAQTGLPLGTVKSRLRLAFTRLRRALESEGVTAPA